MRIQSVIGWFLAILSTVHSTRTHYTPDWASLDSRPLPKWYDEAKIGIFMHFGPYAVPGVGSEWFWAQLSDKTSQSYKYMKDYFPPKFTYQDFGPLLKMEFFNASEISDIVAGSGAKYLVFTSKHHDGFTNWPSTYTYGWNSVSVGPKRNVIGELKTAFTQRHPNIHFGLYYSLFEWFNPIYLKDKASNYTTRDYVDKKMMPELKELIDTFSPDVLWSDGDWEASPEYFGSKDFLAWLYNESPSRDSIVTNDRWGIGTSMKHGGYYSGPDRFSPGSLQSHKWENAMTVDRQSWGNRRDISLDDILSTGELIEEIVKTVSCGGNILVNVGPTKEGTIIPIFQERLRSMGSWIKVNGDGIYGTKPWSYQNDTSNPSVWYTMKDDMVYGIVLGWPENDVLQVSSPKVTRENTKIGLLGYDGSLEFNFHKNMVEIRFPSMSGLLRQCGQGCQWAYVVTFRDLENKLDREENEVEITVD